MSNKSLMDLIKSKGLIKAAANKNSQVLKQTNPRKKLLFWGDSPTVNTGFGVVSRHILKALYNTGQFNIDVLGVNYIGDFFDKEEFPYTIVPARLEKPDDPFGGQMFLNNLIKNDYDIVFIVNDLYVVEGVAKHLDEVRSKRSMGGRKPFKLVYYYPVDLRLSPAMTTMLQKADIRVAYTYFCLEETMKLSNESIMPHRVIYHGVNTDIYKPLSKEERAQLRKNLFRISDQDTFLIINVNRNSARKDISKTILAFNEFRKKIPNSILYLHTSMQDQGAGSPLPIDLAVPCHQLGLQIGKDVIFPNDYSPARKSFPDELLNKVYNCADMYLSTHLGEGFGLTVIEAMSCGIPVIVPNNTTMPELVGDTKGYLYPCKEHAFVENTGIRPVGRLEDITSTMFTCFEDIKNGSVQVKLDEARKFAEIYSWKNVCKQWTDLFTSIQLEESYVPNNQVKLDLL